MGSGARCCCSAAYMSSGKATSYLTIGSANIGNNWLSLALPNIGSHLLGLLQLLASAAVCTSENT